MNSQVVWHNLSREELVKKALEKKEVLQSKSGALVLYTGKYTGRSPNDKYIVDTPQIHNKINWGKINQPITQENYQKLEKKINDFFNEQKEIFIIDAVVGASKKYSLFVRFYLEHAYQALFVKNLFREPTKSQLKNFKPELSLYCAPSVFADPAVDGTNSGVFIVLNLEKKKILIGQTKYLGEIKKSVFSYMNYLLPEKGVLPMHCSANIDKNGKKTALFFGLSGTGKTTLSADSQRRLIGDDEHGWSEEGVFNLEGGCYAKCIRIKKESEPQIWEAIHQKGALLENVVLKDDGDFDFDSDRYTENTRAAYPINFIKNAVIKGIGPHPKYVIFLTADATGVLPPVAHLTLNQAAYHFLSGYTSKLAGTERGVVCPTPTFSAYFGAPFMPQKPMVYLNLLKKYLKKYQAKVFLVNTGWIGGGYGVGHRISIKDTRAIVSAILKGQLDDTPCYHHKIFNLYVPKYVPGINQNILDPSFSWTNKIYYLQEAKKLASLFVENMKKYPEVSEVIKNSGPKI